MTHEDIEATKAPLLEHLVELRGRLNAASALISRPRTSSSCAAG